MNWYNRLTKWLAGPPQICKVCHREMKPGEGKSFGICERCLLRVWTPLAATRAPSACQHQPTNFSATTDPYPISIAYGLPSDELSVAVPSTGPLPLLVCRHCFAFYTDEDAVRAGEKKYQEAQEDH